MSEFLDQLKLTVCAGKGGNGCVSFRREKFVPRGGPDGGNGGRGGHVVFVVDSHLNTLAHIRPNATIRAKNGSHGRGSNKTGANGNDTFIRIPPGTIIRDVESGELIVELLESGSEYIIAEGGKGGRGNANFARPTQQTPRHASEGAAGEKLNIDLELKLLADVGIAGLPNAGKSTLTSVITSARPEIASYPFTTLFPVLGVVDRGYDSFVLADIPGIIEGAHEGTGLGHKFLRHIERTRMLVHLIDIGDPEAEDFRTQINLLENELHQYDTELSSKPKLLVGNKIDLLSSTDKIEQFHEFAIANDYECVAISAATGEGIDTMLNKIFEKLSEIPRIYD